MNIKPEESARERKIWRRILDLVTVPFKETFYNLMANETSFSYIYITSNAFKMLSSE